MMRKTALLFMSTILVAGAWAYTWTDTETGYTWNFRYRGSINSGTETVEIYNYSNGRTIAAISPKPEGSVTVPQFLHGKRVTHIGDSAFAGCSELTDVLIPSTVTSIGKVRLLGVTR